MAVAAGGGDLRPYKTYGVRALKNRDVGIAFGVGGVAGEAG